MNNSYTENATGITKCSNTWKCRAQHLAHIRYAVLLHSLTHSLIHKESTPKEKLQGQAQQILPTNLKFWQRLWQWRMGEETLMIKISNCFVKIYQLKPWAVLENITENQGQYPTTGIYSFNIQVLLLYTNICSKTRISQCQT